MLSSVFVGKSYELVVNDASKSFTQIGIFMPFWGKFFLQSLLGDFFKWNFRLNYFNANTRIMPFAVLTLKNRCFTEISKG